MGNNFSCIIVDDEIDAIRLLSSSLNSLYKQIDIVNTYTYWEDALSALREYKPDIVFMDVSMPGKNGIDLLRLIPGLRSEIIFITAHEDYAIDAFEFSVAGYILKPFEDKLLVAAIDKSIDRVKNKRAASNYSKTNAQKIGIPNSKGVDYININDILYLESTNNYTKFVIKNSEILSSYNIGKFKSLLNNVLFCQVHRSYIVNIDAVIKYESPDTLIMSNKKSIPISKVYKEDFLKIFPDFIN